MDKHKENLLRVTLEDFDAEELYEAGKIIEDMRRKYAYKDYFSTVVDNENFEEVKAMCEKILEKLPENIGGNVFEIISTLDLYHRYRRGNIIYFSDLLQYICEYGDDADEEIKLNCLNILLDNLRQGYTCMDYDW